MDPGGRLGWASREEDSGFVLVFCGGLEDTLRRRKLLKRSGKQVGSRRKTWREKHGVGHSFSLNTVGEQKLTFPHAQMVGILAKQSTLGESHRRSAGWCWPPQRREVKLQKAGFGQLTRSSAKLRALHAV